MSRKNLSEIIFENKAKAQKFFDENLKRIYRKDSCNKINGFVYSGFSCRRRSIKIENGGVPSCPSLIKMKVSFPRSLKNDSILENQVPYSISGIFYHNHDNDEKYLRDEAGGWRRHNAR